MKTLLIALLLSSSLAHANRFVVEAKHKLSAKELKSSKGLKIQAFADIDDAYFSKLYTVSGTLSKEELEKYPWVKEVENTTDLTRLSLEPINNPERLVLDELFPYQWSLLNQGQTYVREKDDIHNIPLVGLTGKDIGWKAIYNKIPQSRPIVAVLDSGVDLNHPDLQGNLWKNEKECGKDLSVDNDKNTLAGDCDGWNFTEVADSADAKSPTDNDGHGSHVAGIIAAANNGIGIVGVNPNALIMPVKVMKDSDSKSEIAASESFAQGIIYATKMGAHVINLSLGWPRALETKHLRNAVAYAIENNVILVAAAGNNNSSEPLFPCAYDGVICVAASTLDGSFAGFSNFGGHIDAITPGEGILSLSPSLMEPDFFSVTGYDIKSGTSQSAPVLAGMLSILKSQKPDLSIDEVYARLYAIKQSAESKKFILGGNVTWDALSQDVTTPVVRPTLKRVQRILLSGENKESKLVVPVRNYGLDESDIKIKVESLSPALKFQDAAVTVSLARGQFSDLSFPLTITDFKLESSIRIKVTITNSEGELSYFHDIPVVRDIRAESGYKKNTFKFTDKVIPLGSVVNEKISSNINTVDSYGKSNLLQFYARRIIKDEKKIEVSIFTKKDSSLTEAPRKIVLEKIVSLVNLIRVDLNLDGKDDFLVQAVNEDENGKYFSFSFYNSELLPLWPAFPGARANIDTPVAQMTDFSFTRMDHPKLGKIMVPTFLTEGQIPRVDQVQDFFQKWDNSKEIRLYYLEPQVDEKLLRIRTLTNTAWKESVKKQIGAQWFETVLVENILPVSVADAQNGQVRVIMSVGQSTKRKIMISVFDTKKFLLGKSLPQIVLQSEGVDTLYSISPTGLEAVGDVFFNVYDRSRGKVVTTKNQEQSSQLNYAHVSETDILAGHVVSFETNEKRLSILQTRDELISLSTVNGQVTKTSRPKLRYSFFSAKVLSEMYTPVIYKRDGQQAPALYVDSTAVTSNRVYLFEEQNGKLVSSIKNSIVVSANCKPLNPSFSATTGGNEFVFLCLEDKEWVLRTYDMK